MLSLRTSIPALRSMVAAAAVSIVFTTGCANNFLSTASAPVTAAKSGLGGSVHGGQQPIVGATITLYAAGNKSNYGTGATVLGTPATTGSGGSFAYSDYVCPSDNAPVYLISKGGQTGGTANGGTANDAAVLMAAIGPCTASKALNNVNVSEVTTVASVFALAQYMNPGTTIGSEVIGGPGDYTSATSQAGIGILNASNNVPLLANISTGQAVTTTTIAGTGTATGVSEIATAESAKVSTLANILAACVNNTNTTHNQCDTLFANATPPAPAVTSQSGATFSKAVDTLQAAYYIATNPTNGSVANLTNLFNLNTAAAPFGAGLASQPTDWTIGVRYSSASACTNAGANFLTGAYHLAADAQGNVWVISNSTGGNLFELSSNGVPLACTGAANAKGTAMTIDINGNIWYGPSVGANVYKMTPAGVTTTWPTGITATGVQAITSDRAGDIFVTSTGSGSATSPVYSFANGANTSTPFTAKQISGTVSGSSAFIAADTSNRVFTPQSATSPIALYEIYPGTAGDASYLNGYDTANIGATATIFNPFGVAAGLGGTVVVANGNSTAPAGETLAVFKPGNGTTTLSYQSAPYAAGLVGPREVALDGAGNSWIGTSNAATSGLYSVVEFSATATSLSPDGPTKATSTSTVTGGFQKDASVAPGALRGVAVDPSGNVWFGNNSAAGTGLLELIGAGVPVITPIPAALAAGSTSGNAVSKPSN